jgi:hypothetical protein
MATGVTLPEMVMMLRAELLQSPNTAHGVNAAPAHRQILARVQRTLWLDHAWTHLRVDRDVSLAANQRYYDLPNDMPLERLEDVRVKWSGKWHPLLRGITPDHYNAFDSDEDVRSDPVTRWDQYGIEQFEVWPKPTTDGLQVVRFRGIRTLRELVDDDHTCDLDADLIVLTAAAELAADAKSRRAEILAGRARALYDKLKQRAEHNTEGPFVLGGERRRPMRSPRLGPPWVAIDRGS